MIRIENKEVITTHTIAFIEILNGDISMVDRFASFPVRIFDENNNLLFVKRIDIKDEEYDAWNSDDYIENLILSKLEMVKAIEITPEVTPEITPEVTPEATPELTPEEIKMMETASGTASDPNSGL